MVTPEEFARLREVGKSRHDFNMDEPFYFEACNNWDLLLDEIARLQEERDQLKKHLEVIAKNSYDKGEGFCRQIALLGLSGEHKL